MANSPDFACPPAPPPAIVGLLVCPRIDVILCRGLRFSFSFCLALPPLQLLPLLLPILPPLNHILCQGRKDAVVKRRGSERGFFLVPLASVTFAWSLPANFGQAVGFV